MDNVIRFYYIETDRGPFLVSSVGGQFFCYWSTN